MENPLVSVICLCYNQSRFVKEALGSVINQSYTSIQLIIVDDASTDGSQCEIKNWLNNHPDVPFLDLDINQGSTRAFNQGLALAKGKYVIDLAADDVLHLERVEKQVEFFENQLTNVGVIYSNAQYISEKGEQLHCHFDNLKRPPFEGDVYERAIDTYFIPTPTMMIHKKVLDELGGYDESLAYEDFDFWVRSSRDWHYAYQSEVLTCIRKSEQSYSMGWYQQGDPQLHSTYLVCEKIKGLNKNHSEDQALVRRIQYELRQSFFSGNHKEFKLFYNLLLKIRRPSMVYKFLNILNKLGLNLSVFRTAYHRLRFG